MGNVGEMEGVLSEGGLLVLYCQNPLRTFCNDLAHETWIDNSATSLVLAPYVANWVVSPRVLPKMYVDASTLLGACV